MAQNFDDEALSYHRANPPGKISVTATKPMSTQRDLSLAYSPGVAAASLAIKNDPHEVANLTARANLVAVITNGTAVLGLGDIGPLAAKPVMEGKGVLFKKFAGIDVFDIELNATEPEAFCQAVAAMEPSFGGINLEDIKAPECFIIEEKLRATMNIPVFHDDQHGTAIIVAAAAFNGLEIVGKNFEDIKIVVSGAGAAALACLGMLESFGARRENIFVTDIKGLVYAGRTELMDSYKERYAQATDQRSLSEVIEGADLFLGLSAGGVLKPEMVKKMADNPLIFALANPTPEILPEEALSVRPDAIIATGRSDYPNQVNNVLCFPFIFRGALDVGATVINEDMKVAAAKAIAQLARREVTDTVTRAYGAVASFGRDYLIPKPFDPRLILEIAPAVAKAAIDSEVTTRPIEDFSLYRKRLEEFVYRSGTVMKPVMSEAQADPKRVVFAEGEDVRTLHAVRTIVDEKLAHPILLGRRTVISRKIKELSLRLEENRDFTLVEPVNNPRHDLYAQTYHAMHGRNGVSQEFAEVVMRTRNTAIGSMMVHLGDADALICGTIGFFDKHVEHVADIIQTREGVHTLATINMLVLSKGVYFLADTHVNLDPDPQCLAEITISSAAKVRHFGITPKIALLSHSNFGASPAESAEKVRQAVEILQKETDLEIEGEMHADTALSPSLRDSLLKDNKLAGQANLLIMPTLDAANIAYNCVKMLSDGISVGPILVGARKAAHILTTATTVRNIVNMTALAVVDAQRVEAAQRTDTKAD